MTIIGTESIWFTGRRKAVTRILYRGDNGKFYVSWYGKLVEVARDHTGYYATVRPL